MERPKLNASTRAALRSSSMTDAFLEAGRLPPQAPELEQAVLGAMMLKREAIYDTRDILIPDSFYVDAHKRIYTAIQALFDRDEGVDILTVTMQLKKQGDLDIAGGPYYISQLTNKVSSTANVQLHARLISQQHLKREYIRIGADFMRDGYDEQTDVFEVLDKVNGELTNLQIAYDESHVSNAGDHVQKLGDKQAKVAFKTTGIPEIDAKIVLYNGRSHVLAARPGVGKSIIAVQIAWHLAQFGPTPYFSLEMPAEEVTARIVSLESGIEYGTILKWRMDEQQLETYWKTIERIGDRLQNVLIDDTPEITHPVMWTRLERWHRKHPLQGFFVDYLQLMRTGDKKTDDDGYKCVSKCSRAVMAMAKKLDIPGVALSQFNREIEKREDKRPKMSDLRESGQIEQDASVIGLMWRPGHAMPDPPYVDRLYINWAKHRGGSLGVTTSSITPALNRIGADPLPAAMPEGDRPKGPGHDLDDAPF